MGLANREGSGVQPVGIASEDIFIEWTENASADNALATATHAAEAGKRHYIIGVTGGYSVANAGKTLVVKDGAATVLTLRIHDTGGVMFPKPLRGTAGNAVSAELLASGTAGQIGNVALLGYTR
jgi:hypothetical protein